MKKLSTYNDFLLKKHMKNRRDIEKSKEKEELDNIELSDNEILEILKNIKSKKYDMFRNMETCRKLQKMGLLRAPKGVEITSSFGELYYLTNKALKLIVPNN